MNDTSVLRPGTLSAMQSDSESIRVGISDDDDACLLAEGNRLSPMECLRDMVRPSKLAEPASGWGSSAQLKQCLLK